MNEGRLQELLSHYRRALYEQVIPFWLEHSLDREAGGYFSCLDRDGSVYNSDKSMLLQARTVWLFSRLHNRVRPEDSWLHAAQIGYQFLRDHLEETGFHPFLTVTRNGTSLDRFFFSVEAYATLACAEYAIAAKDEEARALACKGWARMAALYETPWGGGMEDVPRERKFRQLVVPLLYLAVGQELLSIESSQAAREIVQRPLDDLLTLFEDPKTHTMSEMVGAGGERSDISPCRLIVPGHGIHVAWMLLQQSTADNDTDLLWRGLRVLDASLERGWDESYGGIFYFLDIGGRPPLQVEWDMKLWWAHNEALYATLLAFERTGDSRYEEWFDRIHDYTFAHFPDAEYGSWFGYLHRDGTRALEAKGSLWMSIFHIATSLWQCLCVLERLHERSGK